MDSTPSDQPDQPGPGRPDEALKPYLRRFIPRPPTLPALPGRPGRRSNRIAPRELREELGPPRELSEVIVSCALYRDGGNAGPVPVTRALETAREVGGFVWIGLREPNEHEFAEIASRFELPPLAVEDAVRAHQRPKLERYGDITFVVIKPVRYVDHVEMVDVSELALFIAPHFVIAVRHGSSEVPATVRTEFDAGDELLRHGPGAVLYRAADLVVDEYTGVIDDINVDIDEIEAQVFGGDESDHAQRIYKLKREVLEFRRAVVPFATPLQRLAEEDVSGVSSDLRVYFRDVYDHLLRAADAIESYDKLLTDVLQADLAQVSVRQNQVAARQNDDVRKISAWAAIALAPTLIAGIYGMNFQHMPELGWKYGYGGAVALMAGVCGGLYALFRRNGWL
jgi:magnesium transporter